MIRGITFSEQAFYSADFAHFQNTFLQGGVGVTKGCAITHDNTTVTIDKGYFIAHGRLVNVEEPEIVAQGFAEGYNRIVFEIDLSKENTITEFRQGYIRVLNTEELIQEDLDAGGNVYQFPFCHFQWSEEVITGLVVDAPTLELDAVMKQWSDNFEAKNAEFDAWFADQKTEFEESAAEKDEELQEAVDAAQQIIKDLEADGFEKKSVYAEVIMEASGWDSASSRYSFESTYPFASYNIEIQPSDSCTLEQLDAWCEARIVGSVTTNACKAYGEIPTVDIPIIITVTKKISDSEPTPDGSGEVIVLTSDYSGTAEITTEIDGEEFDIDNMTTQVDSAEDGSIIITKLED